MALSCRLTPLAPCMVLSPLGNPRRNSHSLPFPKFSLTPKVSPTCCCLKQASCTLVLLPKTTLLALSSRNGAPLAALWTLLILGASKILMRLLHMGPIHLPVLLQPPKPSVWKP